MADDRPDRPDEPPKPERDPRDERPPDERPYGNKPGGSRPYGSKPGGDRPYGERSGGGRPPSGRPYGSKPGGDRPYGSRSGGNKPYGNRSGGSKPYGNRPGGNKPHGNRPPGNKPYGNRPPGNKPYGRPSGPRPADDRPRDERGPRPPADRAGHDSPPQHRRQVDYSQRDRQRGPGPQRGSWERDRGPGRPRGDWDRRDRYAPPPEPRGPSPAELLGEDEEIVAGRRPVEEAFAARREVKRMLVVPERRAALDQLVLHATTLRIPVVEVEGGTITAVSGFDGHQGVALVVAPRRWATLDDVLALAKSRGEPPFVLALDHLEDPQNVGTLLRSAEACGVHGVIFPTRGAAPISPAAIKTSAGAVEHLLLVPMSDLASSLVDLHARGLRVIGADGDANMTVREADMRGPIVIVTGSEGRGLNAKVRKRVDLMARIPMRGKVASLNASVAGSVFLFEAAAQRDLPESERADAPELEAGVDETLVPGPAEDTAAELQAEAVPEVGAQAQPEATTEADAAIEPAPGPETEADATAQEALLEPVVEAPPAEPEPPASDAEDLLPEAPPAVPEEPR